jgi:exodeoxyribonuclease-3
VRIATWNVNSLKARLERVVGWLERARPDVLMMQETKLADADAPVDVFAKAGYALAHHGEGRWNGIAIASRCGLEGIVIPSGAEARALSAVCGGIRVLSVYAPNGRVLGSEFYTAKLAWFEDLARWLAESADPAVPMVVGGDMNVAPADDDVWDAAACHGGTHVSEPERAAFRRLCTWGLVDAYRLHHAEPGRYTWWDYRAGNFHKNYGMRIDHLLVTAPLKERVVWAEIDREARKGKPIPSDHAPLVIDIDAPGHPFDAGWTSADERIAARRAR